MVDPEMLLRRFDPVYCWTEEGEGSNANADTDASMDVVKEEAFSLLANEDEDRNITKYDEVIQSGNTEDMRDLLIQSKKKEMQLYDKIQKLQELLQNAHLCLSGVETFVNQKKAFEYHILTDPATTMEMKLMADRVMEL